MPKNTGDKGIPLFVLTLSNLSMAYQMDAIFLNQDEVAPELVKGPPSRKGRQGFRSLMK